MRLLPLLLLFSLLAACAPSRSLTPSSFLLPDGTRVEAGSDFTPPVRISPPMEPYRLPPELDSKGFLGEVVVTAVIDRQGQVTDVKVIRSLHEELDAEVVARVEASVFEPARLDGKPVTAYYRHVARFSSR